MRKTLAGQAWMLVTFLVLWQNTLTKSTLWGKGLFWLTIPEGIHTVHPQGEGAAAAAAAAAWGQFYKQSGGSNWTGSGTKMDKTLKPNPNQAPPPECSVTFTRSTTNWGWSVHSTHVSKEDIFHSDHNWWSEFNPRIHIRAEREN